MNIRTAARHDLPGILEVYNDAVLNTTATYDYLPRTLEQFNAWLEDHQQLNLPVFVATDPNDQVLGWSSLNRFHARPGYRFTAENSIYVSGPHRGQGIGKTLMPPLIDAARRLNFHAIIAGIDTENKLSIRFHTSFGFQTVGHLKEVGFKFNRWLDVIYMQLLL